MANQARPSGKPPLTPGQKVGVLRRRQGLTQMEMAQKLGVSRGSISSYEGKGNVSPSASVIRKLAQDEGIVLSWFYDGKDSPPEYLGRESGLFNPEIADIYEKSEKQETIVISLAGSLREGSYEASYMEDRAMMLLPGRFDEDEIPLIRLLTVAEADLGQRIPEGSVIVFYKEEKPPNNTIVLARRIGTNEFAMKVHFSIQQDRVLMPIAVLKDGSLDGNASEGEMLDSWRNGVWDIWGAAQTIVRPYVAGLANREENYGEFLPAFPLYI